MFRYSVYALDSARRVFDSVLLVSPYRIRPQVVLISCYTLGIKAGGVRGSVLHFSRTNNPIESTHPLLE